MSMPLFIRVEYRVVNGKPPKLIFEENFHVNSCAIISAYMCTIPEHKHRVEVAIRIDTDTQTGYGLVAPEHEHFFSFLKNVPQQESKQ